MRKVTALEEIGGESPTNGAEEGISMAIPYRAEVIIEGVAPYLFHRYNVEVVESKSNAAKGSKEKKSDNIESYVWRDDNTSICIPGEHLRGAIVNAARYKQDPRSPRKSAMDLYKAGVIVLTELSSINSPDWDYLDVRRVVVQRNAVPRHRPALKVGWVGTFIVMVSLPEYISPDTLNATIQSAGKFCGMGDYRPTYGRFNVTGFKVIDD